MAERIQHPSTGKTITVDVFHVEPKKLLQWTATQKNLTAKHISWWLLGEAKSAAKMKRQIGGEGRHDNYALRVFEHALDWSLGLAVLHILESFGHKLPKPFDLLATRKGAILARFASGKCIEVLAA